MYDELVKRLRAQAEAEKFFEDEEMLYAQAADAIDELWKKYLASEVDATNLTGWLAEEHAKHLWIPVTERLPEHGWYLAYSPTIKMEVLHFHSAEEVWSSERYYGIEVTHWMPLPEPPKED